METTRTGRSVGVEIVALDGETRRHKHDDVAGEEPLELRLSEGANTTTLAVTMRTPGNDFELAAGFAYGESIVRRREEIAQLTYCLDAAVDPEQRYNIVTIDLRANATRDVARFERHFAMTSACGICGRAQLDSLRDLGVRPVDDDVTISKEALYEFPARMRGAQRVFESTGGLHAAALFDACGNVVGTREDIGRHNAVDKIVGWALLNDRFPLDGCTLMVSGRASYEILQKAVVARVPIVASVSAPSSLAVALAREFNVTLASFLRGDSANLYSVPERITS